MRSTVTHSAPRILQRKSEINIVLQSKKAGTLTGTVELFASFRL
jgi:hypothetical protein